MAVEKNYLTPLEAGRYLSVSPRTLSRYRSSDKGPAFHRFGGRVRYLLVDLKRWAANQRTQTGDAGRGVKRPERTADGCLQGSAGSVAAMLVCLVLLSGCGAAVWEEARSETDEAAHEVSALKEAAERPRFSAIRVIERRPWLGLARQDARKEDALPADLLEPGAVTMPLSGIVDASVLARRVEAATGISGTSVPEIALRRGYVTAISFTDSTGAPWPIEEALVDRRFLPPGAESGTRDDGTESGRVASHLLYLAPQAAYLRGNAVVKLRGLAEPVVASLRGTGADADFRVEIRLGVPGPNADPGALAQPAAFHAGDAVLLGLLGGTVPPDAERLAVEGGASGDRAWRRGGEVLLITRAHLLSPGPLAAERGPGGRWAYRLAGTPLVLVSDGGREKRLGFDDRGGDDHWQDILKAGDRR